MEPASEIRAPFRAGNVQLIQSDQHSFYDGIPFITTCLVGMYRCIMSNTDSNCIGYNSKLHVVNHIMSDKVGNQSRMIPNL